MLAAVGYASGLEHPARALHRLLCEADQAERHVALYHAAHPVFGDGSLMAAALRHQRHGDARFASAQGRAAWIAVLTAVQAHLA